MRSIQLKSDTHDHQRIYAVMVFPEDALFRQSYLCMLMERGEMPIDAELSEADRWSAPRWAEMRGVAATATRGGILAGDLLAVRAIMDLQGVPEPSNRKALQGIEGYYRGKQYGDGKPIHASPRKVEGADFVAFSSVVHLWAALNVFRADYGKAQARSRMGHKRGVHRFLRFAAYFQQFGLHATTPRTNQRQVHSLLNPERVWYVPRSIKPIPATQLPAFKPEMLERLKVYSHT